MSQTLPSWCSLAESSSAQLPDLLKFATANYGRHTDWFLKHRDIGMRNLAVVLTAEFAVASIHYTSEKIPEEITAALLAFLALTALLLALSAWRSCRNSYAASLETAVLVTKIVWAMGLTSKVEIAATQVDKSHCPVPKDPYLYVPRYLDDAEQHLSTEDFVRHHLSGHRNTFFWAKVTIAIFCLGALVMGIATACAVVIAS
jgi:4-amino-4-deoxy-L-arabinose transferase-like glycosyltransferase